jgi:hypothetical protein
LRLAEDEPPRLRPSGLELGQRQTRGRRGDDGGSLERGLDLAVEGVLETDLFGDALLDELRAVDRMARVVAEAQLPHGFRIVGQPELGQHRPGPLDLAADARLGITIRVVDGHGPAGS